MRALVQRGDELAVEERPTPEPRADQVLIEVAAAGLNRADLLQRKGAHPAPPGWPDDILGLEFAGKVAATGDAVSGLGRGQRVFGIVGGGGHATHLLTRADLCTPVPEALDLVAAGGAPEVFITAHDALVTLAGLRAGERVLINGVGSGVGTAAVQIAKLLGAYTVGTSRTAAKLDRARSLGLDQGVLASPEMASEIGEVDVVVELIGGHYVGTDIEVCRARGRIVVVGLIAGSTVETDLGALWRKRLMLCGTRLRARPDYEKALATAAFAREIAPELGSRLEVVVDRTYPLEDAPAAYDYLAGNEGFGKTILTMEG